jgi:hypothetical protein
MSHEVADVCTDVHNKPLLPTINNMWGKSETKHDEHDETLKPSIYLKTVKLSYVAPLFLVDRVHQQSFQSHHEHTRA